MTTHVFSLSEDIRQALLCPPLDTNSMARWLKFYFSYLEFVAPVETQLETGRLIKLLSENPMGLTRTDLLTLFYADYEVASINRKESFKLCLEKIIQRARASFKKYNLTIQFCKETKKYLLKALV